MKGLYSYINLHLLHLVVDSAVSSHTLLQVEVLWKQMLSCSIRCKMFTTEQTPWKEQEEVDSGREGRWMRCSPPWTSAIWQEAVQWIVPSEVVLRWAEWLRFDIVYNISPVVSRELWVWEWSVTPSKAAHCSWGEPWRSWHLEAGLPSAFFQVWAGREHGWCIPTSTTLHLPTTSFYSLMHKTVMISLPKYSYFIFIFLTSKTFCVGL